MAQCNHKGIYKREKTESEVEDVAMRFGNGSRSWSDAGLWTMECGNFEILEESKKQILSHSFGKICNPANISILAH